MAHRLALGGLSELSHDFLGVLVSHPFKPQLNLLDRRAKLTVVKQAAKLLTLGFVKVFHRDRSGWLSRLHKPQN